MTKEELIDKLAMDFSNPLYPNGGVLTTENLVRAALIVAYDEGRASVRKPDARTETSWICRGCGHVILSDPCPLCGHCNP